MALKVDSEVKFTILENALDFVATSLGHISGDPDSRDLKYSILHLSAGLELLLKDRLRRESWALVFSDLNSANRKGYDEGDFQSVGIRECIKRLSKICNVDISDFHKKAIYSLKKRRNRLEHFATADSAMALQASAARVAGFLLDFISEEYDEQDFSESEKELLDEIRKLLPHFQKLVDERLKTIKPELDKLDLFIVECPRCTIEAASLDAGLSCKFCGYSSEGEEAASEYATSLYGLDWKHVADGGVIPIYHCPECWAEALVDVGNLKQDLNMARMACFECGLSWAWEEIDFCLKCGNPFPSGEDGTTICSDCFS